MWACGTVIGRIRVSGKTFVGKFRPRRTFSSLLATNTQGRVGIALGYKDAGMGWTTEGCDGTLVPLASLRNPGCAGTLVARHFYTYTRWITSAAANGRDKLHVGFGINARDRGIHHQVSTENCLARGFDRTGFL